MNADRGSIAAPSSRCRGTLHCVHARYHLHLRRATTNKGKPRRATNCRSSRPDDLTPPEGEATAPDFEKNLEKDPHEADIPEFAGLNVKNQVRSCFWSLAQST